ncbi:hypothetical protein [Campylobacter lanienae]|uniref:hypothetical protein n=2 Tax=Campylobacter lanienae TaxID=75658 RepID=UPI00112F8E56|nr:hypothetical protein [Campylobacter lanienae]
MILPVVSPSILIMLLLAEPFSVLPPITSPPTLPAIFNSFWFAVPWALVAPVICVTCDILTFSPIVILLKFAVPFCCLLPPPVISPII